MITIEQAKRRVSTLTSKNKKRVICIFGDDKIPKITSGIVIRFDEQDRGLL